MKPRLKFMDPWYYSHGRGSKIVPRSTTGNTHSSKSGTRRNKARFSTSGLYSAGRSADRTGMGPK